MARKSKVPRWRGRFLRALARTANVRASADAAGVDYTTAYDHRKRDAGFAAAWAVALAEGRVSARAESPLHQPSPKATAGPPPRAGEELIVRASKNAGTQMVRAGEGRWTPTAERRFLDALADHGNIRRAAAAAGFSTTAIYARRRRYPDFRERWDAAKECGRERIDSLLIEAAQGTLDPEAFAIPEGVPKVTIAEAIAILRLHAASEKGLLNGRRKPAPAPSIEEVRANILRKLDAIEAAERKAAE